jgi:hypothetical protein
MLDLAHIYLNCELKTKLIHASDATLIRDACMARNNSEGNCYAECEWGPPEPYFCMNDCWMTSQADGNVSSVISTLYKY